MELSKSILLLQENLINYLADSYLDLNNIKQTGKNRLNTLLSEYNVSFKGFSIGSLETFKDSFVYLLVTGISSIDAPHNLGLSNTITDNVSLQVIAKQNVNQANSQVKFNTINLVIQDTLREWWFREDKQVNSITDVSFNSYEPEFYFNDSINSVNNFNSVNAIRYTNTINFTLLSYKD